MELAMEAEDDVFFADLNKQISLLLMDDNEDRLVRCPPVSSLQAFSGVMQAQASFAYEQSCRRESKGTGVFIPLSVYWRRRNRKGRFITSSNTKNQKQPHNSKS